MKLWMCAYCQRPVEHCECLDECERCGQEDCQGIVIESECIDDDGWLAGEKRWEAKVFIREDHKEHAKTLEWKTILANILYEEGAVRGPLSTVLAADFYVDGNWVDAEEIWKG